MLGWLRGFGDPVRVGVEGTGSYGAGLSRYLCRAGVEVLEVDRPNRQARRRKGKTDTVDAIEAARAAQAERELGRAKTRDGDVEAIRALVRALLGLRWGEVAGLRVDDLDLLAGTLRVTQQRPAHGPVGPPKSKAGQRPLSLPATLIEMLAACLAASGLTGADDHELVFTSADGKPIDYSNWRRRIWLPAARDAGVPGAGFHDLRRTNATQLVATGVDIKTAQTRLGHSDPRLTPTVYAQAVDEADRAAAARLNERFFGETSIR